jgi:hypothetical protein
MQDIWPDPRVIVFTGEDLAVAHEDLEADVEIHLPNGRWNATFVTFAAADRIMRAHAETGESAAGIYFWTVDMILVRELSAEVILRTIADLRKDGFFEQAFVFLDDDPDEE